MKKVLGTFEYLAPEVYKRDYDEKCDLWSIGCIMYTILTGQPAFSANSIEELAQKIQEGKFLKNKAYKWISLDAKNLLKGLINVDPSKWLSAEEALSHSWFSGKQEKDHDKNDVFTLEALKNFKSFWAEAKL